MQHLNRSIPEGYEIPNYTPGHICAVQFGVDALLLGFIDRVLHDIHAAGGPEIGVAAVQLEPNGFARQLNAQDGWFTTFVRGELNDRAVRREQVVQSVRMAVDPAGDDAPLTALAGDEKIRLALFNLDETGIYAERNTAGIALMTRFLIERAQRGADAPYVLVLGDSADCGARVRSAAVQLAEDWRADRRVVEWLKACPFYSTLADCMVGRAKPGEAARLCAQMNYADALIHIAEPYGQWYIQADADFRAAFPLDAFGAPVTFTESLAPQFLLKHRIFDAGLGMMAALGCLHGNRTLAECMKDEPLRARIGHAFLDEILPCLPLPREETAPYVIASCERYANAMLDTGILEAASGLMRKLNVGLLPALRAYADAHFTVPVQLTLALAATILLYSSVRRNEQGAFTVSLDAAEAVENPNDADGVPLAQPEAVYDAPEALEAFSLLSPDMPSDSLAYAALADRTLWLGADLREIDGLEETISENLALVRSMVADTAQ